MPSRRAADAGRFRLFPTLAGYRRAWLPRDLVAGLSAGAVVVPQAMAYATIADLPVQVGLYTCMVPMLVYAMLGGSHAMSMSSTSTIATLMATTFVSAGVATGSDDPPRDLVTLTLLVGGMLLVARAFRLGALVEAINKPTILGVQIGVGATVAVGQLPKLLGVDVQQTGHGFIRSLIAVAEAVPELNWATIALSAGSIAVLVLLKRFAPRVPGALVVVVAGILLVAFASIDDAGVARIAAVPSRFPVPELPSFDHIAALVPGALAIAVMAFLETATAARSIRRAGEPQIDSNRELLATGAASVAGSFFQTMPAAGGFSQSAVNQGAGARTQLSSIVTAVLAVLAALFLGPVLSLLPQATLGAMVIVAVIGLIDVRGLVRLARIDMGDFWTALVTALVGLTAGLLSAVAVGVVLMLGRVLHELNRVRVTADSRRGTAVSVGIDNSLYTANVRETWLAVQRAVEQAAAESPVEVAVLELRRLRETSVTVLDALADLDRELRDAGVELRLAGIPHAGLESARRDPWFAAFESGGRVFDTVEAALEAPVHERPGPPAAG